MYQRLLLTLLTIARSRPENLELIVPKDTSRPLTVADVGITDVPSSCGEGEGLLSMDGFITLLNSVFWKLHSLRPKNTGAVPLITPG